LYKKIKKILFNNHEKSTVKLFGILTLTAGLIASCSSSDNPTPTPSSTFTADATNFQGDINEGEVTLDPTKNVLTGKFK
jgi:hypothetical protein